MERLSFGPNYVPNRYEANAAGNTLLVQSMSPIGLRAIDANGNILLVQSMFPIGLRAMLLETLSWSKVSSH